MIVFACNLLITGGYKQSFEATAALVTSNVPFSVLATDKIILNGLLTIQIMIQ